MFNNLVIDVCIGMFFIFITYSLLATIIQEIFASLLNTRAKMLAFGIRRMLEDSNDFENLCFVKKLKNIIKFIILKDVFFPKKDNISFSTAFFNEPAIKYSSRGDNSRIPAYIAPDVFASTVINILKKQGIPNDKAESINQLFTTDCSEQIVNGDYIFSNNDITIKIGQESYEFLKNIYIDAENDLEKFKVLLARWYDDTMLRVNGWYKRHVQLTLFIIGIGLAACFNVDSIGLTQQLTTNDKLRNETIQMSSELLPAYTQILTKLNEAKASNLQADSIANTAINTDVKNKTDEIGMRKIDSLITSLSNMISLDVPKINNAIGIGWSEYDNSNNSYRTWLLRIAGWVITSIAISLGANFWFDILVKFINLRGTGKQSA